MSERSILFRQFPLEPLDKMEAARKRKRINMFDCETEGGSILLSVSIALISACMATQRLMIADNYRLLVDE